MIDGPEKVFFGEPEYKSGFWGRKKLQPPVRSPHFSNLQVKEEYRVKRAHVVINPFSGKKKGVDVGNLVIDEFTNSKIVSQKYVTEFPNHAISIVENLELVLYDGFSRHEALLELQQQKAPIELLTT